MQNVQPERQYDTWEGRREAATLKTVTSGDLRVDKKRNDLKSYEPNEHLTLRSGTAASLWSVKGNLRHIIDAMERTRPDML